MSSYLRHFLQEWQNKPRTYAVRPKARTDGNLPFRLRFGARVELPDAQFVFFGDQLNFQFPGVSNHVVGWSGPFDMTEGYECYEVYLQNDTDLQAVSFLHILPGNTPGTFNTFLFRECGEGISPQTAEEWNLWCVDADEARLDVCENSAIGRKWFEITPGGASEALLYTRVIKNGDSDPVWIPPFRFTEEVVTEPYGEEPTFPIAKAVMIYSRPVVPDGAMEEWEYLMVSKEETSQDARIRIYFGIQLKQPIKVV